MKVINYYIILFCLSLLSCSEKKTSPDSSKYSNVSTSSQPPAATLFKLIPAKESGIDFINKITENERINFIDYFYLYNGGGVAIGDLNNDGLSDIYFTGNQVSGRLYLNKGNMQFEDITKSALVATDGWGTGITFVDINGDGWLDLYVCRSGNEEPAKRTNLLFINNGKNEAGEISFTERGREYGLAAEGYSTQAAFFDYDKDGDLDMYLLTSTNDIQAPNSIVPIRKDGNGPANDRLYRNDGPLENPKFTQVTKQAGILYDGLGLGVGINDVNGDGWEDIYISNDFMANDHLYINNKNGTFSEQAREYLKHQSNFSMGNDLADFNNDGLVDIVVADMLPADNEQRKKMAGPMKYEHYEMGIKAGYQPQFMRNMLQLNNGKHTNGKITFSEIGQLAGVHATDWSWAPLFGDYDNDGLKDLFITNGYRRDITDLDFVMFNTSLGSEIDQKKADELIKDKARKMPGLKKTNYVFRNNGDLTFEDKSQTWGMSTPSYSNGAAYGDLDNDGDLDMVVNNIDEPAFLYQNTAADSKQNHYLKINLQGSKQNRSGLGADIRLYHGAHMQLYHHAVTRGYQSSLDYVIHVGLGTAPQVDSLEIVWPDGKVQWMKDVAANQTLILNYQQAATSKKGVIKAEKPLLTEASDKYTIHYAHKEDEYNDFARQFLLPHKHSRLGPGIAVGDMNGDKLEDFYVSGPFNQSGELFFQTAKGNFQALPLTKGQKLEEEIGCLLFDADNDNDLDLYIASGGNEFGPNSAYYQDKLYMNDGKGRFQHAPGALPIMRSSSSCVMAADFDKDGDLDLFVGGRLAPLQYPMPGNSYLLLNDKGIFKDVTDKVAPNLRKAGMITTALWTDFDQDGHIDLMVAGEFMPIRFFKNVEGAFTEVTHTTGLLTTSGWWNSLNGADFDNDGDIDYIAGNLGLNSKYKASPDQPVSVYAGDFDGNGSFDPILTHYIGGREFPAHSRDEIIKQMVPLRRKFVQYAAYARANLNDILDGQNISKAFVVRANLFESVYIENIGQGKFRLKPLPIGVQMAPVFGTLCEDIDGDSNIDILLVGNSYATEVVTGQYDAFIGLVLKGDGHGNFAPIPSQQSGFFVDGDAKGLARLTLKENQLIVATQNNGSVQVFNQVHSYKENTSVQIIPLQPSDAWAEIIFKNGEKRKQEFYYGASYISQSSRTLIIPKSEVSVTIFDFTGKSRKVQ